VTFHPPIADTLSAPVRCGQSYTDLLNNTADLHPASGVCVRKGWVDSTGNTEMELKCSPMKKKMDMQNKWMWSRSRRGNENRCIFTLLTPTQPPQPWLQSFKRQSCPSTLIHSHPHPSCQQPRSSNRFASSFHESLGARTGGWCSGIPTRI
jgi:hypothetical protein